MAICKRATHALGLPHGQRFCRAQARVGDGRKAQRAGRLQRVWRRLGAPRPAGKELLHCVGKAHEFTMITSQAWLSAWDPARHIEGIAGSAAHQRPAGLHGHALCSKKSNEVHAAGAAALKHIPKIWLIHSLAHSGEEGPGRTARAWVDIMHPNMALTLTGLW